MSLIRPEALAFLHRWREVIIAAGVACIGLWVATRGGPVFAGLGGIAIVLGAGLSLTGWRRLRFAQGTGGPGVVEVVEREVRFFGPSFGGAISLAELAEIRLVSMRGVRLWRLKQTDGQTLLIPVNAAGADALYDAFEALPGIDMPAVLASLAPENRPGLAGLVRADQPQMRVIWQRKGPGIVA